MDEIARLRIELDEVTPKVVRRIKVPLRVRLDDLHLTIQAAMSWENCHLFEFEAGRSRWGVPEPGWGTPGSAVHSAKRFTLADLLGARRKQFSYVYDFGDDWRHTIRVEAILPAEPDVVYPRLLTAEGRCPPEDVGGPWGYAEYLEALNDPHHERHEEVVEWGGPQFDPHDPDETTLRKELAKLAKRFLKRKPATKQSGS
jgi:Plasmid pRiA4b ORF-3-like protein